MRLGDVVYNFGQKNPDTPFTYIDVASIDNVKGCLTDNLLVLPPADAPSRARKIVKKGCVLYATVRPYLLNICIINQDFSHEPIASTAFAVLNPFSGLLNQYLYYILRSPMFIDYVNDQMTGMAYPAINDEKLYAGYIPLPPLAEQRRIVARLEELMPLIDAYDAEERRLSALETEFPEQLRRSLLQYAVEGKLVEQRPEEGTARELLAEIAAERERLIREGKMKKGKPLAPVSPDEVPFEIPESWEWVRLGDLGLFMGGKTPSMGDPTNWGDSITWVTSKDMKTKYISSSELMLSDCGANTLTLFPRGTLLMVVRSGILRRTIPISILTTEATINQDLKAFQLYCPRMAELIYSFLKGMETIILQQYVKTITTVESIKFDEFSQMPFPLPPLAEQRRIVARLEELMPLIDRIHTPGSVTAQKEK